MFNIDTYISYTCRKHAFYVSYILRSIQQSAALLKMFMLFQMAKQNRQFEYHIHNIFTFYSQVALFSSSLLISFLLL